MSRIGDQYRYGNYRNSLHSPLHALANNQELMAAHGWNQANNRNVQVQADLNKYGHGDPRANMDKEAFMAKVTPEEAMAQQASMAAQHTRNQALHAEMVHDKDRQMDLAENQLMAKSSDSRYAADRGVEASNYQADKQVEGLRAINEGFNGVLGNLNNQYGENAPNVYYTDEYGNPIGQTTWNQRNRR